MSQVRPTLRPSMRPCLNRRVIESGLNPESSLASFVDSICRWFKVVPPSQRKFLEMIYAVLCIVSTISIEPLGTIINRSMTLG